jgi:hypothetical protein
MLVDCGLRSRAAAMNNGSSADIDPTRQRKMNPTASRDGGHSAAARLCRAGSQSARNATVGSTRVARSAGMQIAGPATVTAPIAAPVFTLFPAAQCRGASSSEGRGLLPSEATLMCAG